MSFPEKKLKEEKARRNLLKEINKVSVLEPDEKEFWARWGFSEGFQQGIDFGKRSAKREFLALLAEQRKENKKYRKAPCTNEIDDLLDWLEERLGVLEERLK